MSLHDHPRTLPPDALHATPALPALAAGAHADVSSQIDHGEAPAAGGPAPGQSPQTAHIASKQRLRLKPTEDDRTAELRRVYDRLRQTQLELMRQEKMSMLGQLVGGVAHEVNTPTGAILNTCVDARSRLQEFLALTMDPDAISSGERRWLSQMVNAVFSAPSVRSDMAIRNERRQVERQLREAGHAEARRMAEVIAAYGKSDAVADTEFVESLLRGQNMAVLENAMALKAAFEISEASARKIARIVHSLRLYNHSGEGQLVDIDVNESLDNMLVVMQNRIKHVATVKTDYAADLPPVKCAADVLQVWTNILSNACDAIESHKDERPGVIRVVTRKKDESVVVEIGNNGPPILPEHQSRLFTPFFTTKGMGKGTGLGLSICASILRRYGGTITAANDAEGVVFCVRLPCASPLPSGQTPGTQAMRSERV